MASKIPCLSSVRGTRMTDDEKIDLFKGARPKQTAVKSCITLRDGNSESTKMKPFQKESKLMRTKIAAYSGLTFKPKTTNEKTSIKFNIQKTENIIKGNDSEQKNSKIVKQKVKETSCGFGKENTKLLENDAEPDNLKKTGAIKKKTISNFLDKSPGFSGLTLKSKERRTHKPTFKLGKSIRRSKTESDLKIGKPLEQKEDKLNETIIVHRNKSKTINHEELMFSDIISPEFSDPLQNELAQELIKSKKDNSHGGLMFLPKVKRKSAMFKFNIDQRLPEEPQRQDF